MDAKKVKEMGDLFKACFSMPKIELHAHLNGCIRPTTLVELAEKKKVDLSSICDNFGKDLERCFKTFQAIHMVCDSLSVIRRITHEMIEDFSKEGVVYLEIRTTPKDYPGEGTTIEDYIRTVVEVMKESENEHFKVRLLVSINRASPYAVSEAIINAAIAMKPLVEPYLVGIDFGGDPKRNKFKDFEPLFMRARKAGLKSTIHTAEVVNLPDNDDILAFRPERVGHGVLLSPPQLELIKHLGIPIECCPSSNMSTLNHYSYTQTPNVAWMKESNHPFCLCTDDTILFKTNASSERFEIAHAFGYTYEEMCKLELSASTTIFDDALKPWVAKKIQP